MSEKINYLSLFNSKIMKFDVLCPKKHDHSNGQSIRYIRNDNKLGDCIECKQLYMKSYYEKNKEKINLYSKNYRERNKEVFINYNRNYQKQLKVKERRNELHKEKWNNNEHYRINRLIGKGMNKSLKGNKNGKTWETLVDYTYKDLMIHLEQFKVINIKQEIDHIIPISFFEFTKYSDLEFKLCWSLKNLQYISKENNLKKLNYYAGSPEFQIITFEEFKDLLNYYNITLLCNIIWNEYYQKISSTIDVSNSTSDSAVSDIVSLISN